MKPGRKPLEPGYVGAVVSYKCAPGLHNRLDVFAHAHNVAKGTASRMLVEKALCDWENSNTSFLENDEPSMR